MDLLAGEVGGPWALEVVATQQVPRLGLVVDVVGPLPTGAGPERLVDRLDLGAAVAGGQEQPGAVEEAVLESESAVVEAWLSDLPEDQREAVRRRVLADEDYDAIARDLECSPAVVRQRVSRGIATLRKGLES